MRMCSLPLNHDEAAGAGIERNVSTPPVQPDESFCKFQFSLSLVF